MKFLLFMKPISGPPPTPEQLKLNAQALDASVAVMQKLKRQGKVESYYGISGIPSGFAVVDVSSHDELNELIMGLPITMYGQTELYPLITVESANETLKRMIAQPPK